MTFKNFSISLPIFKIKNYHIDIYPFVWIKKSLIFFDKLLKGILFFFAGFVRTRNITLPNENTSGMPRKRFNFGSDKIKKISRLLLIIGALAAFVVGVSLLLGNKETSGKSGGKVEVKGAKASQDINKEFSFPLKDSKGEVVANVKYVIEKAELLDEILVEGKRATAVKGREFLIITLKIANEYTSPIEINTRDYARLSINGNRDEWLAPDIHNDPVEVQAISTKYTRVGFPIDDTSRDLVLRVGEINGDKEEIPLNLE